MPTNCRVISFLFTCADRLASTAKTPKRAVSRPHLLNQTKLDPETDHQTQSSPEHDNPITTKMAGDTQETSSSEPQQLETWDAPQYEAALAHLERLQERVRHFRTSQSSPKANRICSLTTCDRLSHQQ